MKLKKTFTGHTAATALLFAGLLGTAHAAPVEYNGHYYMTVQAMNHSWDLANEVANEMSFEGLSGHLATFTTQAEFEYVVGALNLDSSFYGWVGCRKVDGVFTWVNDEGPADFSGGDFSPWYDGQPASWNYGAALGGAAYETSMFTESSTFRLNNYIVEFEAVPEPTSLAMLSLGCAALLVRRRSRRA